MSRFGEYSIVVSDSKQYCYLDYQTVARMIENFSDCQNADGRFKVRGTKYFFCEEVRPCTTRQDGHAEWIIYDGMYRMKAYGGYECGGRGCFYEEVA